MPILDPNVLATISPLADHDPNWVPDSAEEAQEQCPECSHDFEKMIGNKPCSLCDGDLPRTRLLPTIISGFPGVGKTEFVRRNPGSHDSDSSQFSWQTSPLGSKARNPDFPANYIRHIRGLTGAVMVSSHKEVRDALTHAGLPFRLAFPARSCKQEYIERYRSRGSPPEFIGLVERQWDLWIDELLEQPCVSRHILLQGQFLSDVINISRASPVGFKSACKYAEACDNRPCRSCDPVEHERVIRIAVMAEFMFDPVKLHGFGEIAREAFINELMARGVKVPRWVILKSFLKQERLHP